ncbi:MAG: SAM-dependent methyltransferase [Acidobacteria bacterium]|nr:MAG: SAM-dependent methyltransferase [Acidobacteriota bacterium]
MKEKQPSDQLKRPVYDQLAERYDRAMQPLERLCLARWRAAALRELPAVGRLLEVGAGTGLNFRHYPPNARGAAVELSFEMLRRAHWKTERPADVALVQARAESLPFADDSFDAALATLVFCSVASPPMAFAELRRVVRAGGRIVLLEHVRPDNLLAPLFDCLNFFTARLFEDHFNRRTALEATTAGLRVLRVERHLLGCVQLIVCEV